MQNSMRSNVLACLTAGTTGGKTASIKWSVLVNPGDSCRVNMRRGAAQGISHVSQDQLIRR